ncbi:hypothetical protein ES702_04369 [subsurface metagenome]
MGVEGWEGLGFGEGDAVFGVVCCKSGHSAEIVDPPEERATLWILGARRCALIQGRSYYYYWIDAMIWTSEFCSAGLSCVFFQLLSR